MNEAELTPEARRAVQTLKRAHAPRERDRRRVHRALRLSIATATFTATSAVTRVVRAMGRRDALLSGAKASVGAGWGKLSLAALVVAGGTLVTWMASQPPGSSTGTLPHAGKPVASRADVSRDAPGELRQGESDSAETDRSASSRHRPRGHSLDPTAQSHQRTAYDSTSPDTHEAARRRTAPRHRDLEPNTDGPTENPPTTGHARRRPHERRVPSMTQRQAEPAAHAQDVAAAREPEASHAARASDEAVPPSASSSEAEPAGLAGELDLIQEATYALKHDQLDDAFRALAAHRRRFPSGTLAQERDALQAIALCRRGGGHDAARRAERFLTRNAGSPLARRVRQACETAGVEP